MRRFMKRNTTVAWSQGTEVMNGHSTRAQNALLDRKGFEVMYVSEKQRPSLLLNGHTFQKGQVRRLGVLWSLSQRHLQEELEVDIEDISKL